MASAVNRKARRRKASGQSLVEFVFVVPILLIILLTVADFARYFATGITAESAARNAAEIVAQEYLRNPPGPLTAPAPQPGNATYYDALHVLAASTVCGAMGALPDTGGSGTCPSIPVVVCIHDGADPQCPTEVHNNAVDPACAATTTPPPTNVQTGGSEASRYVEVRLCYRFSTIFSFSGVPLLSTILPFLHGDFYILRSRTFTVADY